MSAPSEGGAGGGPVGGGSTATVPSAPLKTIKIRTQQLHTHAVPSLSLLPSIYPSSSSSLAATGSLSASASASLVSHSHPPLQLRGVINKYSLPSHLPSSAAHPAVAAKITHVKSDGGGGISIAGTPILSGGTIKVAAANPVQQTSLGGTPIALNAGQATTAASIRAIGAGGQSTQVRVVMPMIKQLENVTATGRTQITAIPAAPARSGANASITVTRPVTQATYLPRASVTATQMGGVGVGVGQRLRLSYGGCPKCAANKATRTIAAFSSACIRPPVTMTAKVQPSLTITQLNPIGKLSAGGGSGGPTMAPQGVASIQAVPVPNVSASVVNPSSVTGATSAAGGATVLPLTISGRGAGVGPGGNILTGTLTPIKNASGITLGKMMMAPASSAPGADGSSTSGATVTGFQRTWNPVVASQSQLMKIDEKGSAATIYYESMPASASTGVLSLTTTTVTQSTQAQAQLVSSAGGSLSVSSLPFASHATAGAGSGGGGSQATFTVLPSGAGGTATRTIGHQQLIIPAGPNSAPPQHMVIPLHTSVKVTTGAGNPQQAAASGALVSSFMRKRDAEGSPIRAAKNLGPTLLSMASNTSGQNMPPAPGTTFNIQPVSVTVPQSVGSGLTVEALAKKERERVTHGVASSAASVPVTVGPVNSTRNFEGGLAGFVGRLNYSVGEFLTWCVYTKINIFLSIALMFVLQKMYSSHQSIQQNLGHSSLGARSGSSAFVDMQAPTPQQQQPQQVPHLVGSAQMQQGTRMNGTGNSSSSSYDCSSRKKARRSTNDSQHSTQSQASLSLPPPSSEPTPPAGASYMQKHNNGGLLVTAATPGVAPNSAPGDANHRNSTPAVAGNKENANPVDFVIRRPRNCALLNTYKPTHKLANNHFHRYTDVKPREERRATVIDLANQPNVQGKINGWKIYHLRSQMEDLNESEVFSLGRLETMLQDLEKDKEKHSEIERVTELLKGNIQRSKLITDGINEAQNQLMKIFEHKPHVSDIITRCASKRNFKKREKI
ncbi:GD14406 [Drosophila simulans]|uniref:GD14406 n=1 Tax=Drosophila simulans TaxID=7240 RepID=B4QRS1_DROSI|nr:GD14406 [Drosophila simulans]